MGLILYRIYKYMFSKPDNFPPGPPRLPFLGSYPLMLLLNYKHLHLAVDWLCKYYETDVLGMYCGNTPTIVANSNDSVRAILNHTDFDGKPVLLLAKLRNPDFNIRGMTTIHTHAYTPGRRMRRSERDTLHDANVLFRFKGIFNTEGPTWHEQRRYTLRYLRDFGFGRRFDELENDINDEITNFIDLLKNGPKYEHEKVSYECPAFPSDALNGNVILGFWTEIYERWLHPMPDYIRRSFWQLSLQSIAQRTAAT